MAIGLQEIGFDFDGVIADTANSFAALAKQRYSYQISPEDITSFELEDCCDLNTRQINAIFQEIMEDSLACNLQPMPGALQTLSALSERGGATIITARPLRQPVELWLQHHLSAQAYAGITLEAMGDHDDKVRYAREHGLTTFVDDRGETCRQFAADNFSPLLFDQPWNQQTKGVDRVRNWDDIKALLDWEMR